jgi:hypothetical protein
MKIKNLETPRNIVFSGTGSKTLNILDQDTNKYGSLKKLFESIQPSSGRDNSNDGVRTRRTFLHSLSQFIADLFGVSRKRRTFKSKVRHETGSG